MATAKVNLNKLRVEFSKQVVDSNSYRGLARGAALSRVKAAQEQMVSTFENHKITQELEAGADYSGPSVIRYHNSENNANLYSFIGFPAGTNPVQLLRELLSFPIDVKLSTRVQNTYYFIVLSPTTADLEKATPMPSEYISGTFSWARGVEDGDGLIGLGNFLSIKASASRSGGGIQVEVNEPLATTIDKTPYITDILEAFRKRLELLIR